MKVALYLRMSTDKQDTSIPQQRAALERHAERVGHDIVAEYLDEGISGDKTEQRAGFQSMLADAPTASFDRILCFDQDRFGRFDIIEAGIWVKPLRDAGVTLETIAEGVMDWNDFAGRLIFTIKQEAGHQFLQTLSRNVVRGLTDKATKGRGYTGGPTPFGYLRKTVIEGRYRVSTLEVDPATAPLVERMFAEYAKPTGSCRAVAAMLNASGIRPPRGQVWRRNTVNRMLTNRVYCGDHVWGRRMKGRYHARNGDDIVRRRPGDAIVWTQPIERADAVPALVPRPLFEQVQNLLISRQTATRAPSTGHPLSGLMTCAACGAPMHSENGRFRCSTSSDTVATNTREKRCSGRRFDGEAILAGVMQGLESQLLKPAVLRKIEARLKAEAAARAARAAKVDVKAVERQIDDLDRQVAEGVARLTLVPRTLVEDMAKGIDALRAQRERLKQQVAESRKTTAGKPSMADAWVADALGAIQQLRETVTRGIAAGDAPRVNHWLRMAGVRVTVEHRDPTKQYATVAVFPPQQQETRGTRSRRPSGDLSTTGPRRGQAARRKASSRRPVGLSRTGSMSGQAAAPVKPMLSFRVPLPPAASAVGA